MSSRLIWFWLCALLGIALLACGWLMPAYLRAVDASVLQKAGRQTPGLAQRGLDLLKANQLGAAELLLRASREQLLPDRAELGLAVTNLAAAHPAWQVWGGGDPQLEVLFGSEPRKPTPAADSAADGLGADTNLAAAGLSEPLTDWVIRLENRGKVLDVLQKTTKPAVQELLRCRLLTNTVVFAPSQSASGQALDAAISICGLLLMENKLAGGLSNSVFSLAAQANHGGSPQPLEETLMDLLSLGQRFNWGQLTVFLRAVDDPETLRLLSGIARKFEPQLPLLFAAVDLSGKPAGVARYVANYSQTGLGDLGATLRYGAGGLQELLRRQQRFYNSNLRHRLLDKSTLGAGSAFAVDYGWRWPGVALAMKWLFYLASGFFLAMALHFAWPSVSALERPLQVRGFHLAREILFALGFLVVVLLLSEPFLAQESQKAEFAIRLRLPTVGSAVAAGSPGVKASFMDPKSLLTLLLFFVLQSLLYTACLVKLAEIQRQRVQSRIKLRLLENEDHLFDAGLYLGFAGTIVSLILVSLGIIKQSLMAAYSSTSFGIIFVSIFKIFHLRPARRRLLLQSETELQTPVEAPAARPMAAPL
jgi:hypothetical protein